MVQLNYPKHFDEEFETNPKIEKSKIEIFKIEIFKFSNHIQIH